MESASGMQAFGHVLLNSLYMNFITDISENMLTNIGRFMRSYRIDGNKNRLDSCSSNYLQETSGNL